MRWRNGQSREQFLSWNRGGATDGPVSRSQTESEVALLNGPESSSWTETEGPLRMVQWAVLKLK